MSLRTDPGGGRLRSRLSGMGLPSLVSGITFACLMQGAFWFRQMAPLAVALVIATLVLVRVRGWSKSDWPAVAAGAVLAFGLLASAAATGWPGSLRGAMATIVIACTTYLIASVVARAEGVHLILMSIVVPAGVVAALGIAGLATHHVPWVAFLQGTWRIGSTLTYSNAAAAIFAMTLPASLVLSQGNSRRASMFRVLNCLISIALLGTLSRGGILAAVLAIIVLTAFRAVQVRSLLQSLTAATIGAAALLPSILSIKGGPIILIVGVSVACAGAWKKEPSPRSQRAMVAFCVIATIIVAALIPFTRIGATRLTLSSDDRSRVWSLSFAQATRHPIFGTGPGTYRLTGIRGDAILVTCYAHNEYLQTFAETGVVGLCAVAIALVILIRAAWRSGKGAKNPVWAAALAGGAAFLLHSSLDFIWHIPAVVMIAFVLLAAAVHHELTQGEEND